MEVLPFHVALVRLTNEGKAGDDKDIVPPAMVQRKPYHHYKIADLKPCPVPEDAESHYYATCFAADNNAL